MRWWLLDLVRKALRSSNRDALHAVLEARLRQQDTAHWIDLLNEAGVPCGPINTVDQAFNDPQAQHLGIVQQVDGVAYLGQPMNLSRTPSRVVSAPPDLGEHTAEVLRELGFDAAQIERLAEQGIV